MREILFRGKRLDNGEWVFGDFINSWHLRQTKSTSCVYNNIGRFEIATETIGQFTGLTDKNGKKVFEGDIVKTKYGRLCVVEWRSTPCFCGFDLTVCVNWEDFGKAPSSWDLYMPQNLEIVGNIYDNPELLGV